jgi:hypothetical protein
MWFLLACIQKPVLSLGFSFHLEGWETVEPEVFGQYSTLIWETQAILHQHGAVASWEMNGLAAACEQNGSSLLTELEASGDGIGIHTDGDGEADFTEGRLEAELNAVKEGMERLGVTPLHASGVCGPVDWVAASRNAGMEVITGIVGYCLTSLDSIPPEGQDCAEPADCHDPYPTELSQQLVPWYAESGQNWTTPSDSGIRLAPFVFTLSCASELTEGYASPTDCAYTNEDNEAALARLKEAEALAEVDVPNSFVLVLSIGEVPDLELLEALVAAIEAEYLEPEKAVWKKLSEI